MPVTLDSYALTTLANLETYLGVAAGSATDRCHLAINGATGIIESALGIPNTSGHRFKNRSYVEWLNGTGDSFMVLPRYPITAVSMLSIGEIEVASIQCGATDATEAYISTDGDGITAATALTLTVTDGASAGATSLAFATYATMTTLQTAVNAATGSWSMTIHGAYTGSRTVLIRPIPKLECAASLASLTIPEEAEDDYLVDWEEGIVRLNGNIFTRGTRNIYCSYTAGFSTVPRVIEQVCLELAARIYNQSSRDTTLQSESLGDYSYTVSNSAETQSLLDADLRGQLAPFVDTGV